MFNAGYGTLESVYKQSLAVVDTQTGVVEDLPDDRTPVRARACYVFGPKVVTLFVRFHLHAVKVRELIGGPI